MTDRPLAGRTAVVTGASRGIGAAAAHALAAAGARVALAARSGSAIEALARSLGDAHLAVATDLATPTGVNALVAAVTPWAGGAPDILVNNAGIFAPTPLDEQDPEAFAAMLRLNLESPFRLLRAFVAAMRTRGSGHVVTIGSVADRSVRPGNAAYSASKYGLRALHEALRAEMRGTGVRASLVSPGPVDTPIWDPVERRLGRDFPAREAMLAPDDVARAIVFVVSQPPHVDVEELRLSHS